MCDDETEEGMQPVLNGSGTVVLPDRPANNEAGVSGAVAALTGPTCHDSKQHCTYENITQTLNTKVHSKFI